MGMRTTTKVLLGMLACALLGGLFVYRKYAGGGDPFTVRIEGEGEVLRKQAPVMGTVLRRVQLSLVVQGSQRTALLLLPQKPAPGTKYPLVFVLHGDGGTADGFHEGFSFERGSGEEAILVYPDGRGRTWDLDSQGQGPDLQFMDALLDKIKSEYPIDTEQLFAVGYSSGGFLANLMACHRPGLLRGISSSAGGAPYKRTESWPNGFPKCPGQRPTPALVMHGTLDFGVTLSSGKFDAAYWAYINQCDTRTWETTGYEECRAYRGCDRGAPVAFCEIPPLGHWVWSSGAEASWSFFRALRGLPRP